MDLEIGGLAWSRDRHHGDGVEPETRTRLGGVILAVADVADALTGRTVRQVLTAQTSPRRVECTWLVESEIDESTLRRHDAWSSRQAIRHLCAVVSRGKSNFTGDHAALLGSAFTLLRTLDVPIELPAARRPPRAAENRPLPRTLPASAYID